MKNTLLLLFLALTFVPAYSQLRKRQDIQKNPLDISEYFLLIPSESNWAFQEDASDPFVGRQQYFKPIPQVTTTMDKKNAYFRISDVRNELESRFTMCYFVKADKSRVIAVSYYGEGGDCDSHLLKFYTYANYKWTDVTKQVLPKVTLKSFKIQDKDIIPVDILYTLPQLGTSISVKAVPVCEQANAIGGKDFMAYFEEYKKLPYKELQLKWNREKGVFELGEVK